MAAPAANAYEGNILTCGGNGGSIALGKLDPGIEDTAITNTATVSLLKDLNQPLTKPAIGGTCAYANGPALNGGVTTLNVVKQSAKLTGTAACVSEDPPNPLAYPLNGKLTLGYSQLDALSKPYQTQSYVRVDGFDETKPPNVVNLNGIAIKGVGVGAVMTGQIAFDPVRKPIKGADWDTDGLANPGYEGLGIFPNDPIPTSIAAATTRTNGAATGYITDVLAGAACQAGTAALTLIEVFSGTMSGFGTSPDAIVFEIAPVTP